MRSSSRASVARGNGHCLLIVAMLWSSIATMTTFDAGFWVPRIEKRSFTEARSSVRSDRAA